MIERIKQRTVTLMNRACIDGNWIRTKAVYGKNGRVVPGLIVLEGGREIRLSEVSYELRFYLRGKPHYRPVGKNASDAEEKRKILAIELTAAVLAKKAGAKLELSEPNRKTIEQARAQFLTRKKKIVGWQQARRYEYATEMFIGGCDKIYIDQLDEDDLIDFIDRLRKEPAFKTLRVKPSNRRNAIQRRRRNPVNHRPIGPKTVFNYYMAVRHFLLKSGVPQDIFPPTPKFEEPEVTIYTPEQIEVLYSILHGPLRIALSLMLKCGLRMKEVAHAYFSDINYNAKVFTVRGKPEFNFHVKNYVQREIPIPDDFLLELKQYDNEHPRQRLIVPNENGKPDLRLLRKLKKFVYLHGLRCGRCDHCLSGNPECEDWELHRFRRTYATAIVRHVDLKTAQTYLGHLRISSSERYLKAASAAEGQTKVSAIDFTKSFYGKYPGLSTSRERANSEGVVSSTDAPERHCRN
ncbi:MAG: site-specific integrase [Terracidiphilus sp.]|jgi:integrase